MRVRNIQDTHIKLFGQISILQSPKDGHDSGVQQGYVLSPTNASLSLCASIFL